MERVEYQIRGNLFEKERRLAVTEHELFIEEEGAAPERIELSSISEIRLVFAPTRAQSKRFECTVTAAGKKHKFISMHFRGLLDFEDRGAGYATFCRALCARAFKRNPSLRCVGGHTPLRYYLMLTLAFLTCGGFLAFVIAFWDVIVARTSYFFRILIVGATVVGIAHYAYFNRPRQLDATALSEDALPKLT